MAVNTKGQVRAAVAEEVRALLARRRVSGVQLAARIGCSQPYLSRRLNAEITFDVDDLQRIAEALEVEHPDLHPGGRGRDARRDPGTAGAQRATWTGQRWRCTLRGCVPA